MMDGLRYVGFGLCSPAAPAGTFVDGLTASWPLLLAVVGGAAVIIAAALTIKSAPLRYGVMGLFTVFVLIAALVAAFFFQLGATCPTAP